MIIQIDVSPSQYKSPIYSHYSAIVRKKILLMSKGKEIGFIYFPGDDASSFRFSGYVDVFDGFTTGGFHFDASYSNGVSCRYGKFE